MLSENRPVHFFLLKFAPNQIIALLRHDTDRAERRLTFQPDQATAPVTPGPQNTLSASEDTERYCASFASTPPTTPSPEFHPRPDGGDDDDFQGGVGLRTEDQTSTRPGWAMRLLGMGGRGGEVRVTLEEEGSLTADGILSDPAGTEGDLGESARGGDGHYAAVAGSTDRSSESTAAAGGESPVAGEQEKLLADAVTHGFRGEEGEHRGGTAIPAVESAFDPDLRNHGMTAPKQRSISIQGAADPPYSDEVARGAQQSLARSSTLNTIQASLSDDKEDRRSQDVWTAEAWVPENPDGASSDPHQRPYHPEGVSKATGYGGGSDVFNPGAVNVPPNADLSRDKREAFFDRGLLRGSPDAADQSLDTVSLLSEPVTFSQDTSRQHRWLVSSLWAGVQAGGGTRQERGSGESEAEAARRLARSLAARLKEKALRCEELEDLCGLRDDQVGVPCNAAKCRALHLY